jgi:hypothetical protein
VGSQAEAKVLGIGLNKTATFSLHEALGLLGYNGLHHGGLETMTLVHQAIDEGKPMLTYLDPSFDAFTDIFGITYFYFLADAQYPGSRFILTVRDLEDWLDSRRRHVEKNQQMSAAGAYHDGFLTVDIDGWRTEYLRHEAVVRAYFANRPSDLLVLDITAGQGWEPLCEFLDRPVPEAPFPWKNQFRPWAAQSGRSRPKSAR